MILLTIVLSFRLTLSPLSSAGLAKLIFVTYDNMQKMLQPLQKDDPSVINTVDKAETMGKETKTEEKVAHGEKYGDAGMDTDRTDGKRKEDRNEEKRNSANAVETIVNTKIISASVNRRKNLTDLAEPMMYTLEHKTVSSNRVN